MLNPDTLRTFRLQKGMSLQTVAEKAGTTKSQIDKLEKGERRLTVEWLLKIAEALEVEPAQLLYQSGSAAHTSSPPVEVGILRDAAAEPYDAGPPRGIGFAVQSGVKLAEVLLPVHGMIDPLTGQLHNMREIVSYVQRPSLLQSSRQAMALYCPDAALEPRYCPGDLLYVSLAKPATLNCFICLIMKNDTAVLGQFISRDTTTLIIKKLQPPQTLSIDINDIRSLGRIVGSMESA